MVFGRGLNTQEFTYADGTQILKKNWDGQGIEFGSSGLDHDGNIDPAVAYDPILPSGHTVSINIQIEGLSPDKTQQLADNIREYNQR